MAGSVRLINGDSKVELAAMPEASIDAVVTDPPYELGFMGKSWDGSGIVYDVEFWSRVLRVLKPGGHLLAFGGTRTYHRMACAIEDAGFEVRDSLHWIYGSGFPKSLDVSKALDKAAGARGHEGKNFRSDGGVGTASYKPTIDPRDYVRPEPITDDAKRWLGWGTALKPAHEPVVVARKPLVGTVAANVQQHGTGALNIDGCRVGADANYHQNAVTQGGRAGGGFDVGASDGTRRTVFAPSTAGRWPPNILLSHTPECGEACAPDCPVAEIDRQSEASRFFPVFRYQAKASKSDRGAGNIHPTVKPVALMEWLVKLVTPPGGTVLDPFLGSGTTGVAATSLGFSFVGIEREPQYFDICKARIDYASESNAQPDLFADGGFDGSK